MPCWVVPAVAAEFWGVSVEQVMADVDAGRVGACTERDVLFVDVTSAIESYPSESAIRPPCRRSLAWTVAGAQTVVTPAERDALLTLDDAAASDAVTVEASTEWECEDPPADAVPESVHDEGEPAPLADGPEEIAAPTPAAEDVPQWESVRSRISRMRRPPTCISDAAQSRARE